MTNRRERYTTYDVRLTEREREKKYLMIKISETFCLYVRIREKNHNLPPGKNFPPPYAKRPPLFLAEFRGFMRKVLPSSFFFLLPSLSFSLLISFSPSFDGSARPPPLFLLLLLLLPFLPHVPTIYPTGQWLTKAGGGKEEERDLHLALRTVLQYSKKNFLARW